MTKPCVVFDTNALVSALMYPDSVSARALVKAIGSCQLVASDATWVELEQVTARKKFAKFWSEESRLNFLVQLARATDFYSVTSQVVDCKDVTDNKFLELAVDSNAQVIVSGDAHLREMHPYRGIAIVSPSQFMELL